MNGYYRAPRSATGSFVREDGLFTTGYTHAEYKERHTLTRQGWSVQC